MTSTSGFSFSRSGLDVRPKTGMASAFGESASAVNIGSSTVNTELLPASLVTPREPPSISQRR